MLQQLSSRTHEKNVYDTLASRDLHSDKEMVSYDFILCDFRYCIGCDVNLFLILFLYPQFFFMLLHI